MTFELEGENEVPRKVRLVRDDDGIKLKVDAYIVFGLYNDGTARVIKNGLVYTNITLKEN